VRNVPEEGRFQRTLNHPAYNSDPSRMDYLMFPVLKQNLSSQKVKDGREVATAVTRWII